MVICNASRLKDDNDVLFAVTRRGRERGEWRGFDDRGFRPRLVNRRTRKRSGLTLRLSRRRRKCSVFQMFQPHPGLARVRADPNHLRPQHGDIRIRPHEIRPEAV
jgi:hypothetical protein